MAKMKTETLLIIGAIVFFGYMFMNQEPAAVPPTQPGNGGTVDLCKLVDGQASFTGQRMFLAGTALTAESVRVIRQGSVLDLGQNSLDSGTVSTTPGATYNLYYGENSSLYYTKTETYNAPCQDATDDKVGVLALMDTSPAITTFDEDGQPQSATTENAQALGADEEVTVDVKIKATADECYGNPDSGMSNAICFQYNSTVFNNVKTDTGSRISTPYSIGNVGVTGKSISCYPFNVLCDNEIQVIKVSLQTASTEPVAEAHGVNITLEDIAFDLDADTLEPIWGFEDEDNNNIGVTSAIATDTIYVS